MFEYDKDLEMILRKHEGWVLSHTKISKILEEYQKILEEYQKILEEYQKMKEMIKHE